MIARRITDATEARLPFSALASSEDSAYVLTRDLKIACVNAGWRTFAEKNGGQAVLERWPEGACIEEALGSELREFYLSAYRRVRETGTAWDHEYECSTADNFRAFKMLVYPLQAGELLVVNSLIVKCPHAQEAIGPNANDYVRHGVIVMCCHCRRTKYQGGVLRWDWVPGYVQTMPDRVSHGLCEACTEFYYPE